MRRRYIRELNRNKKFHNPNMTAKKINKNELLPNHQAHFDEWVNQCVLQEKVVGKGLKAILIHKPTRY